MLRQWQLIQNYSEPISISLASIARDIDRVIFRYYGNLHTKKWMEDYQKNIQELESNLGLVERLCILWKLSRQSDYCTPCSKNDFFKCRVRLSKPKDIHYAHKDSLLAKFSEEIRYIVSQFSSPEERN